MNNELLARLRDLAHYDRATIEAAINALSAPSATAAPDRPDWARQLPGAELYDRDHGYDRSATLNAGRYVCTCGACPDAKEPPK